MLLGAAAAAAAEGGFVVADSGGGGRGGIGVSDGMVSSRMVDVSGETGPEQCLQKAAMRKINSLLKKLKFSPQKHRSNLVPVRFAVPSEGGVLVPGGSAILTPGGVDVAEINANIKKKYT